MTYLNANIKFLRKKRGLTQQELALKIGLKRSLIGAYEEHRAEPKITTIQALAYYFKVSLDHFINSDLSEAEAPEQADIQGRTLRILPVVVDRDNKERITVVPVSAEAGYAGSYGDPEYIEQLPSFSLPLKEVYAEQTYRFFQINGDSMLPVPSGSYIVSKYVEDWRDVKNGQCYIVVTVDQGIVYKRVWNRLETKKLLLKSDNSVYEPYEIELDQIKEIWSATGYLSFELPEMTSTSPFDVQQLSMAVAQLQAEVANIKSEMINQKNDTRELLNKQ